MRMLSGIFIHTAGPNTALIKSSGGRKNVRVVIGGRMTSMPIFQQIDELSLALRTITVHTKRGTTINGVGVDVTSCCQVKIQGWSSNDGGVTKPNERAVHGDDLVMDISAIKLAAQHFIGKSDAWIENAIQKTIAGHQRAIIGVLTVEQLYRDRAAFSKRVLDLIYHDMRNMGLTVVSYTVAEISDELGYIEALGVTQTELVKREATEGASIHQSQAKSRQAKEEAQSHLEVNRQYERQIESDKLRAIKQADAQKEIDRRVAIKEKAHAIAAAEQDSVLFVEQQKAKAAEAIAELQVMKQRVEKEKLEKERQIHVDADASLYKANREGEVVRMRGSAEAERLKMIGLAEAEATKAKGMAEVEILKQRLAVWKEFGNHGVILERMIEVLPKIAGAIAEPLSKTDKMVFVGSGNGGGPSMLTEDINRIVAEVPETISALTGFDIAKGIANMMNGQNGQVVMQGASEGMAPDFGEKVMRS